MAPAASGTHTVASVTGTVAGATGRAVSRITTVASASVAPLGADEARSASDMAAAELKRSAGRFASARCTTLASAEETPEQCGKVDARASQTY